MVAPSTESLFPPQLQLLAANSQATFTSQNNTSKLYRPQVAHQLPTVKSSHPTPTSTPLQQQNTQHNNPTIANMSNSVQDQTMAETKANDTPVETPIEKGKGKAADDTMDDDEDDSESGEVSCASLR